MSEVRDRQTSPWIIDVARTAYMEGMREVARAGLGRELTAREEEGLGKIAHRAFALWWDKAAGPEACGLVPEVPVPVSEALALEPPVDGPSGDNEGHRHDDDKNGL